MRPLVGGGCAAARLPRRRAAVPSDPHRRSDGAAAHDCGAATGRPVLGVGGEGGRAPPRRGAVAGQQQRHRYRPRGAAAPQGAHRRRSRADAGRWARFKEVPSQLRAGFPDVDDSLGSARFHSRKLSRGKGPGRASNSSVHAVCSLYSKSLVDNLKFEQVISELRNCLEE
eukprot:COSAG02_NODE_667_length_18713_cov_17.795262_5_plen_170_part_00